MYKNICKLMIVLGLVLMVTQFAPKRTHAFWGVGDITFTTVVHDNSVSGIANWVNNIAAHLKSYVLDHLAVAVAKQILHQLTLRVIDWINNGYHGSPAFITNPGDFFADVADKVTGDFISKDGTLKGLCSPFSLDIRLGLTLEQGGGYQDNYSCTLSDVIRNTRNGVSVNGRSMEGFLAGDFSQGGWPAFIAMTTEPQNNPASAFLQAQSQLQADIGKRNSSVSLDLKLGGGFLSYENCSDIQDMTVTSNSALGGWSNNSITQSQDQQLNKSGNQSIVTGQDRFGNSSTIQKKTDPKTGAVKYQNCQTQTPGSAVASKLFTNINSPEVELELANDMNAVISAAVTQLSYSFMQKGLHAMSSSGSGNNGGSYTQEALQQVIAESNADINSTQTAAVAEANAPVMQTLSSIKSMYDQAVTLVSEAKTNLLAAATCFDGKTKTANDYAATEATTIRTWTQTKVDPILADLLTKQSTATSNITQIQQSSNLTTPKTLDELRQQLSTYNQTIQNSTVTGNTIDTSIATKDLADAQGGAQQANQLATQLQAACTAYPETIVPVILP